jgi:lipoate-protein ligase A
MAADEAILDEHLAGNCSPTLRIYGFNPPALSLGANQKLPTEILQRVSAAGFDVVRRPSGGRAVLHLGDLTYSFVGTAAKDKNHINSKEFLLPSVNGAYRQICGGLILAFNQLGLELEFGDKQQGIVSLDWDCFATTMAGDLHVNGLKIIGSAQLRRKTAVLQHGTIILRQDARIIQDLLQPTSNSLEPPPAVRHANLYDLLKTEPTKQEFESHILHGFQGVFGVTFRTGQLSRFEQECAEDHSNAAKFVHSG